jgi:hypothetical protein
MNQKKYNAEYVRNRYIILRRKALDFLGGKCSVCGYYKCYSALDFHHKEPELKEFDWKHLQRHSWKTIEEELNKCVLLCSNCHRELHNDCNDTHYIKAKQYMAERIHGKRTLEEMYKTCPICNKEFRASARKVKCCSVVCANIIKRRPRGATPSLPTKRIYKCI